MLNLYASFDTDCFNDSYVSCRLAFQHAVKNIPHHLVIFNKEFSHLQTGPEGDAIACDVVLLGNSTKPKNLLVLISGTHGVEGFAGSAVQVDCLQHLGAVLDANPHLGVLLIHAFNPWGFAWLRRADHQGIDLNRNFIDFNKTPPVNNLYETLRSRLTNQKWSERQGVSELWSEMTFAEFLEQLTRGQYVDNCGMFYGGTEPSWSRQVLEEITAMKFIIEAETITVIDLHTGLGPYGYGEVINDHQPGSAGFEWAERIYGQNAQSAFEGSSVSTPKLGLLDYHWHEVIKARGCFVTLEFGTYSAQQLVTALLQEQLYQNQLKSVQHRDLNHQSVSALKSFFYPCEISWQQQIIFRARQVINMALTGMQK